MLYLTNTKLVQSKVRMGNIFLLAALLVFGAGLAYSWIAPPDPYPSAYWVTYIAVMVGFVCWSFNHYYSSRWGPRSRLDGSLIRGLKGLDQRFSLHTFVAPDLPDYILLGPTGIHVLVTRTLAGTVTCQGDRWSRERGLGTLVASLFGSVLGKPAAEAQRGVAQVEQYITKHAEAELLGRLRTQGVVVFTNPKVILRTQGCAVAAFTMKELRPHLRRWKWVVSSKDLERVRELLTPATQ